MSTDREEAQKRRAERREQRREKLGNDDERPPERASAPGGGEADDDHEDGGEQRPAHDREGGQFPSKTVATAAAVGVSLGAAALAGKKVLSSRGKDTQDSEDDDA